MSQNIPKCHIISQVVTKCPKLPQKCRKMFQNVPKSPKVCNNNQTKSLIFAPVCNYGVCCPNWRKFASRNSRAKCLGTTLEEHWKSGTKPNEYRYTHIAGVDVCVVVLKIKRYENCIYKSEWVELLLQNLLHLSKKPSIAAFCLKV